jgi:hypothetical protein
MSLQPAPDGPPELPGTKRSLENVRSKLFSPTAAMNNSKFVSSKQDTASNIARSPVKGTSKSVSRSSRGSQSSPAFVNARGLPTVYEELGPPIAPPSFINGREVSAREHAQMNSSIRLSAAPPRHINPYRAGSMDDSYINRGPSSPGRPLAQQHRPFENVGSNSSVVGSDISVSANSRSSMNTGPITNHNSHQQVYYNQYGQPIMRSSSVPKQISMSSHLLLPTAATKGSQYVPPEVLATSR